MKISLFCLLFLSCVALSAQQFDSYSDSVLFQRQVKDKEFGDSLHSPLSKEDRAHFHGLSYFAPDTSFRVKAVFLKYKKQEAFVMKTSTDRVPVYHKYGYLVFTLQGKTFTLQVYRNKEIAKRPGMKDYLFIPFTDLTNGSETYGGGRYIDFRIPKGKEAWLDFNMSYNPYCAYSAGYSCPVPPEENFLNIRVGAGEKNFGDH